MNKLMSRTLLELFAIIAERKSVSGRHLMETYIEIYFSRLVGARGAKQQKEEFTQLIKQLKSDPNALSIGSIYKTINKELPKGERILLLSQLIEFVNFSDKNQFVDSVEQQPIINLIDYLAEKIGIPKTTLLNLKYFVSDQFINIPDQEKLVYGMEKDLEFNRSRFVEVNGLKGFLVFFYIEDVNLILFKYNGSSILELNSRLLFPKIIYTLQSGSIISLLKTPVVFYNQILKLIKKNDYQSEVILQLKDIQFTHKKTQFGVKNVNFASYSGELVGIIGGSGSGKTTLLNIINGNLDPISGSITINGIYYKESKSDIQKQIGFVPQDDSLVGELTVYENLYFTTALSIANKSQIEIKSIVENYLSEFSLYHIRNQKVGTPIKRMISGGQRKRLNILSELVREPQILLVDEPTSGLSSLDSHKIIQLLKEQTSRGKLVVVNIHQPSSKLFRLFDKILVLDQGGYMVFYGNPIEAISYFVEQSGRIEDSAVECATCHSIKPHEIFDILEEKLVDDDGGLTETRKRLPEEWSKLYYSRENVQTEATSTKQLPVIKFEKPSKRVQFKNFFKRFALTKVRDHDFLLYSLLIPVLLAILISFFSKYSLPTSRGTYMYSFYENENIPVFILMSILACLFTGLIITADCMIRDSLLRKRERLLFLNHLPYINSKVAFFFVLSIIQTFIFTTISALILNIRGEYLSFFILLLIISGIGNICGILVSSITRSTAAAYIIVPFLIIPQIIFSGITISYEKLNHRITSQEKVPLIGDITFSRWGVEALIVKIFKDNDYQKHLFEIEKLESQTRIKAYYLIPEINDILLREDELSSKGKESFYRRKLVEDGLKKLGIQRPLLEEELINKKAKPVIAIISSAKEKLILQHSQILREKNQIISNLSSSLGSMDLLFDLKNRCANKGIEKLTLNRQTTSIFNQFEGRFIQKIDPIYTDPSNGLFNAQLFAPYKLILDYKIDTYYANTIVLVVFYTIMYGFLLLLFRFREV